MPQVDFLTVDVFKRAQGADNFKNMLLMGDNKVSQYITTAASDPATQDKVYDPCVEAFNRGVSAFRDISRTGRTSVPIPAAAQWRLDEQNSAAAASTSTVATGTKVRLSIRRTLSWFQPSSSLLRNAPALLASPLPRLSATVATSWR
jgi:hypothetical protein